MSQAGSHETGENIILLFFNIIIRLMFMLYEIFILALTIVYIP